MSRSVIDHQSPIGVFDSGLGGLTVAAAIRKILPTERIVYLGDTARVPYGPRSTETIQAFALQNAAFLRKFNIKLLVVACNTVSAVALEQLRAVMPEIAVTGVILPGVRAACETYPEKAVVIGTKGTVRSGVYIRELHNLIPALQVRAIPCPLFVPFVEEGILEGPAVREMIHLYLAELHADPPDILIPGCTHYPLLKNALFDYLPKQTKIIDCAKASAEHVAALLTKQNLHAPENASGSLECYVTDSPPGFESQAEKFLGYPPDKVEKVTL